VGDEQIPGFHSASNIDRDSGCTYPGTNGDTSCSADRRWKSKRRAYSEFGRLLGHFSLPSFEPPLAGPGPILNKSRVRQVFGNNGRPLPPGTGPLASSLFQFVGDYSNLILKPEAAEAVKKHGENVFINAGMQMIR
jgi:hypothetical protein